MFIDRMLNSGSSPVLDQVLKFTAARHRLIANNIANVDTPNYRQQDLSLPQFQQMLASRAMARRNGEQDVRFDDIGTEVEHPTRGILAHDGNNRSMEQLMTDQASNALMHNMAIEMLKKQYSGIEMALKERIA